MARRVVACCLVFVLATSLQDLADAQEVARTWTSSDGKKIEATLQAVEGDQITLVRADGKTFTIPLARLSHADQAYAKAAATKPGNSESAASEPQPAAEAMTPQRYQQLLAELAAPESVGVRLVNDSVVQLAPFVQIDMAAEAENFVWRKVAALPPVFVAEGTEGHEGERLVFKVQPKMPAETANKVEFNTLVQLLKEAKFEGLKATDIEALNDDGTQYQFYVGGTSPAGGEQHFYTYLIYLADRVLVFQASAASDERATAIIQLGPTAQLLEAPVDGNLPDAVRRDLEQTLTRMRASLEGDDSVATTLELLMSDETLEQMKSEPQRWEQIQQAFKKRKKEELLAAIAKIDFGKATYDAAASQVTFPIGRRPLVFVKKNGRWSIEN